MSIPSAGYPERIVCLTEEPTEVLYALGQQHRIVGISQFTVRPPEARRDKPKVSAFTSARKEKILALEPDLVIGFSDIQADIAADLIRSGVEVWISNHRSVAGILSYVRRLGAMVGAAAEADAYARRMEEGLDAVRRESLKMSRRPRVYFEEWHDPNISGIEWVSELIQIAGGDDIFEELAVSPLAKGRIIADPDEIVVRRPDIVLASWCGRKVQIDQIRTRPGWENVAAVARNQIHEIDSSIILQPGPAALTDGLAAIRAVIAAWSESAEL